jgi:hypothetical protein
MQQCQFHDRLTQAGIESRCKTQMPTAAGGRFSKDRFDVDLGAGAVTCPAGVTTPGTVRLTMIMIYFTKVNTRCGGHARCTVGILCFR